MLRTHTGDTIGRLDAVSQVDEQHAPFLPFAALQSVLDVHHVAHFNFLGERTAECY